MYINKEEVLKILDIMNKFPEDTTYVLESDSSSGIGSIITLTLKTTIEGVEGDFTVEISSVEDW